MRGRGWLCQFSFILSVFSASYPHCSGDASEFYRTLLPLSGVSQAAQCFYMRTTQFCVISPVDSILFSESACVKPKA